MSELNIALAAVGGSVLVLGLLSGLIRRNTLSEPLVALLVGVLLGPAALGLLDPAGWGSQKETILEQAARLTLAISLMGVALRLPKIEPLRDWRSLAVLLGLVMPLMWLTSGLLMYLILGVPFLVALLVGAVVTPTDPVVSSTIATGDLAEKNLPDRVRYTLSAESGANGGLAYPFVLLPILLLSRPPEEAVAHWLTHTLLWEVGVAVVFGTLIGYGAGQLLEWAHGKGTMEHTSSLLGRVRGMHDALFLGWFGPIGVAALYYASLSVGEAGVEEAWVVGNLVICASILIHGLSATPLTRLYGKLARGE